MCFLLIDSTNEFSCIHAEQHVKIEDNNEISYVVTSTLSGGSVETTLVKRVTNTGSVLN